MFTEIYSARLTLTRMLLDQLGTTELGTTEHALASLQLDQAAAELAEMHLDIANGCDPDSYPAVSLQRDIKRQSTQELDPRWARLVADR